MPSALTYPGVYVEEVPSGVRTITGVATSITAFVGSAPRGPVDSDAASPVRMEQIEQVNEVLREIGADHVPQILVWNKIDSAGLEPAVEHDEYGKIQRVFVSAKSGAGLDLLREAIA